MLRSSHREEETWDRAMAKSMIFLLVDEAKGGRGEDYRKVVNWCKRQYVARLLPSVIEFGSLCTHSPPHIQFRMRSVSMIIKSLLAYPLCMGTGGVTVGIWYL